MGGGRGVVSGPCCFPLTASCRRCNSRSRVSASTPACLRPQLFLPSSHNRLAMATSSPAQLPSVSLEDGNFEFFHLPNGELEARFLHACLFSRKVRAATGPSSSRSELTHQPLVYCDHAGTCDRAAIHSLAALKLHYLRLNPTDDCACSIECTGHCRNCV